MHTHENLLSWMEFEQYRSKKKNLDPRKLTIDQNTKITTDENILLYSSAPTCGNMFLHLLFVFLNEILNK